jgi:hypothetical protein
LCAHWRYCCCCPLPFCRCFWPLRQSLSVATQPTIQGF